jgi:hypothetical protein
MCGVLSTFSEFFHTCEYYIAKKKQGKELCGTRKLSERY